MTCKTRRRKATGRVKAPINHVRTRKVKVPIKRVRVPVRRVRTPLDKIRTLI